MKSIVLTFLTWRLFAATIPAGTEMEVRLADKVASESPVSQTAIHAFVIAPVLVDGKIAIPAGPTLTGSVKLAKAASDKDRAQLQLVFNEISDGKLKAPIEAVVSRLENARESVDDKGVITGIDASQAYGSRLNQGIAKLEASEKLSALATILQGAKETLKIQNVNANVDYDAGA